MTDKIPITVEVPKADVWLRNDYRDIVCRLGPVHLIRASADQFDDAFVPLYDSETLSIFLSETERLRAALAKANDQAEHFEREWYLRGDEIERLRAECNDKRELLRQLGFIRTHLYAATVQRSPADDRIIADHVEQAYLRANEVIKTMETKE